jgi:hypothetical protein
MEYNDVKDFTEGVAPVKVKRQGWGFMGKDGKMVVEPVFDELQNMRNGIARANTKGKWGWIDSTGKTLIAPTFDDVEDFHGLLAPVKLQKKWGLVDKNGKIVVPCVYKKIKRARLGNNLIFEVNLGDGSPTFDLNQKGEKVFE